MRRAVIALIALLLLAARSPSAPWPTVRLATATAPAQGAACRALAAVEQSLTSLSTIDANTTLSKAQVLQRQVTFALNRLVVLTPGRTGPILIQVQSANNQLAAALKSYPDNPTMGQTSIDLHALKHEVTAWQGELTQLASARTCTP
jgi:hypothetical protein